MQTQQTDILHALRASLARFIRPLNLIMVFIAVYITVNFTGMLVLGAFFMKFFISPLQISAPAAPLPIIAPAAPPSIIAPAAPTYTISQVQSDRNVFLEFLYEPFVHGIKLFDIHCLAIVYALLITALMTPLIGPFKPQAAGRSLRSSVIGAAGLASVLSTALLLGCLEVINIFAKLLPFGSGSSMDYQILPSLTYGGTQIIFLIWLFSGAMWTYLLRHIGRSRDPNLIGKLVRKLFIGSALETTLSIPLVYLAARRNSCLCELASFFGIVIGITSLICLCGPAGLLLLTRKSRQMWIREACPKCGYPRKTHSTQCSECGFLFLITESE